MAAELPVADLFASRDSETSRLLMAAMDGLNGRFGRETVRAGGLVARPASWGMWRANLPPSYTTRIEDMMRVRA